MNDTERDLLERAARAAGVRLYEFRGRFYLHYVDERDACSDWNPLTDDGDCARLEAACMLDVEWQTQHVIVGRTMLDKWQEPYMLHDGDKQAARRFAAVRAAASMADPSQSQDT